MEIMEYTTEILNGGKWRAGSACYKMLNTGSLQYLDLQDFRFAREDSVTMDARQTGLNHRLIGALSGEWRFAGF